MTRPTQSSNPSSEVESVVIQTVAEQPLNADEFWETLEAKGIQATPGVIHLALAELSRPEGFVTSGVTDGAAPAHGLTARDLAVIAELAAKVGGVEQLRRLLKLVGQIPKGNDSLESALPGRSSSTRPTGNRHRRREANRVD